MATDILLTQPDHVSTRYEKNENQEGSIHDICEIRAFLYNALCLNYKFHSLWAAPTLP